MYGCDAYLRGSLLVLTPLLPSARLALYGSLVLSMVAAPSTISLAQASPAPPVQTARAATPPQPPAAASGIQEPAGVPLAPQESRQGLLLDWAGLQVVSIAFEGVSEALLAPLPGQLAQQAGVPLDPAKVRDSLRRLYATGLYQTIEVAGVRAGNNVSIIFSGTPRLFVGRVNVNGVKDDRLASVLQSRHATAGGNGIF
jgi:outer membrane protein insertion porin family